MLSLDRWSGIILGGGSFTFFRPRGREGTGRRGDKSELIGLLDQVVAADFPFLGACYGIGALGSHQGGTVDRSRPGAGRPALGLTHRRRASPTRCSADVPRDFRGVRRTQGGPHRAALAHGCTWATSAACPVQAFRVGEHVYATQFHPELDLAGVQTRIDVYSTYGYFDPSEAASLRARSATVDVMHPMTLLRNFSRRYAI